MELFWNFHLIGAALTLAIQYLLWQRGDFSDKPDSFIIFSTLIVAVSLGSVMFLGLGICCVRDLIRKMMRRI